MIPVKVFKAAARLSGKALAYLDPEIMVEEGLLSGQLLRIQFCDQNATSEIILRLGPEYNSFRGKKGIYVDRFYWNSCSTNPKEGQTTVWIAPVMELPELERIELDYSSAPYIPFDDPYRRDFENTIRSFNLPVQAGNEVDFILPGKAHFYGKVKEIRPRQGVIGRHTIINYESEEDKLRVAREKTALKRATELLEIKLIRSKKEREAIYSRIEKIHQENEAFNFDEHKRRKKELEDQNVKLNVQKDRLNETRQALDKALEEVIKSVMKNIEILKEKNEDVFKQLVEDPENRQLYEEISQLLGSQEPE